MYAPSPDEMPTLEVMNQRLGRREADQVRRVESASQTGLGWSCLDIPGGRSVDRCYRELSFFESMNDGGEWLSNLTRETEALSG